MLKYIIMVKTTKLIMKFHTVSVAKLIRKNKIHKQQQRIVTIN